MNEIFIVYNWLFSLVVSLYKELAGVPGVARGLKKRILKRKKSTKNCLWVPSKSFSPFGPAVWPAIHNIYTNVLFYYIDDMNDATKFSMSYTVYQLKYCHKY